MIIKLKVNNTFKITIKSYNTNLILVTLQPDDLPDL